MQRRREYVETTAFDPETILAIDAAFERTLTELKIVDPKDPRSEIIARRLIMSAQGGEQDPVKLYEIVLKSVHN